MTSPTPSFYEGMSTVHRPNLEELLQASTDALIKVLGCYVGRIICNPTLPPPSFCALSAYLIYNAL